MFSFFKLNNNLKREELVDITNRFIDNCNKYSIFEIPDKNYLDYFKELKNKLNKCKLKSDSRFVTYGRLELLRKELTDRLNDENLRYADPNWKDKWDNRMGAFWDLYDYIIGNEYISIGNIPSDAPFKDTLAKNDEYYKEGYICKDEKKILLDMINEIEQYILHKKLKVENKIVFNAYEGGYFGTCEFYYIEKDGDKFKFKYGISSDGKRLNLDDESNFNIFIRTERDYKKFVKNLKDITKDWKEKYINPNVMDGTQWNITIEEFSISFSGSNEFPNNYDKLKELLSKYFKTSN